MSRSTAREAAMQLIYARMLGGDLPPDAFEELLGWRPEGDDQSYLMDITEGVLLTLQTLDQRIEAFARDWSLERMARVDLAILRLAAYEMLRRDDVPTAVAINEAVELSRRFSSDASGAFINGILGNLGRAEEQSE